jgi:hypothetical protein
MKKLVDVILIKETNHGKNKPGELRKLNKERARAWVEDLQIAKYAKKIPGALSITEEEKAGKGSLSLAGKGESNEQSNNGTK